MNRRPLWIVLTFVLVVTISGCSSSHKTPPAVITVAITTAPPASLEINASATIAATVTSC
jgi:predicted component of type VI protein secretion system